MGAMRSRQSCADSFRAGYFILSASGRYSFAHRIRSPQTSRLTAGRSISLAFARRTRTFANAQRSPTNDSLLQVCHFDRGQRCLESLVAHLQASAINRLLQRFASQHTERMRNARLLRRLPNPPRNFIDDHVVMRRIAAQQTANANDGVVLPSLGQRSCRQRNLKSPRHANQRDIFLRRARAQQSIVSALKKAFRDEGIEPRNHDRKPLSHSAQATFDSTDRRFGKWFQLYFLFRSLPPRLRGEQGFTSAI